jgi:hypothetical protein
MRCCDKCRSPLGPLIVPVLRFELCLKCGEDIEKWVLGTNHMLTQTQYDHLHND